ncbi:hypothetical protein B296_00052951 [Ensete ventricosum]|uniref:Uncharacterized protein n=1 Tax=Ensete ventricosum TaxID=4639 RepID=A0A426YAC9_ENSVE|nr:hypothetical protein B296_00052951 [Ensete ventricosum]
MWQCAVRSQLHPGPVAAYVRSIDRSTGGDAHEPYRGGGDTREPRRSHEKWELEFPTCLIQRTEPGWVRVPVSAQTGTCCSFCTSPGETANPAKIMQESSCSVTQCTAIGGIKISRQATSALIPANANANPYDKPDSSTKN